MDRPLTDAETLMILLDGANMRLLAATLRIAELTRDLDFERAMVARLQTRLGDKTFKRDLTLPALLIRQAE
jgi:hypothetical protein